MKKKRTARRPKPAAALAPESSETPAVLRIRRAAGACIVFAWLAIVAGVFAAANSPSFGGDAYTAIVDQLATANAGVAWLAAVMLFVAAALLRALADIVTELRIANEFTIVAGEIDE